MQKGPERVSQNLDTRTWRKVQVKDNNEIMGLNDRQDRGDTQSDQEIEQQNVLNRKINCFRRTELQLYFHAKMTVSDSSLTFLDSRHPLHNVSELLAFHFQKFNFAHYLTTEK